MLPDKQVNKHLVYLTRSSDLFIAGIATRVPPSSVSTNRATLLQQTRAVSVQVLWRALLLAHYYSSPLLWDYICGTAEIWPRKV
jgi:hypothetical protein